MSRTQYLRRDNSLIEDIWILNCFVSEGRKFRFLLPASMKLLDGTQFIKELLIDQSRRKEELIVGHELVNYLLFQSFGLLKHEMLEEKNWKTRILKACLLLCLTCIISAGLSMFSLKTRMVGA